MLFRSVENQIVPETLPRTVVALAGLGRRVGETCPASRSSPRCTTTSLVAVEAKTHTRLGTRLNYESSGISSLMRGTGRDVEDMDPASPSRSSSSRPTRSGATLPIWQTIKLFSGPYTAGYLLNAVDLQLTPDGIALKPPAERIYVKLFLRTMVLSLAITFCLPAARLPDRLAAREPAAAHARTCC